MYGIGAVTSLCVGRVRKDRKLAICSGLRERVAEPTRVRSPRGVFTHMSVQKLPDTCNHTIGQETKVVIILTNHNSQTEPFVLDQLKFSCKTVTLYSTLGIKMDHFRLCSWARHSLLVQPETDWAWLSWCALERRAVGLDPKRLGN